MDFDCRTELAEMNEPLFIPSLFSKVLAAIMAIVIAGLVIVGLLQGTISTLDIAGTLVSAVIVAYIVHLWVYYWKRTE